MKIDLGTAGFRVCAVKQLEEWKVEQLKADAFKIDASKVEEMK